jgi:spermidine synthase
MAVSSLAFVSIRVGSLTAANTAGGVLGSLSAGFFLIPFLGLQKSFYCTTGINLLIGILSLFFLASRMNARMKWIISFIGIGLWIGIPFQIKTKIPADFLSGRNTLIQVAEGINSNCAVVKSNNGTSLEIDRLWQGDDRKNRQIMAAHVPMVFHNNPRDILVIGIGTGQTASRFLYYPVRKLDCVDIEPQLPPLIRKFFPAEWMSDTRVSVIIDDGRNYIAHTANAYDIVSIEVGQAFRPNIASFYTVDFYQKILRCLKQDGIISQFISLAALGPEEYKSVIKSFLEVFPQSILWYNSAELLLIGSPRLQPFISKQRIQGVLADSAIADDLRMAYWGGPDLWLNHPEVFIAGFLSGAHSLAMLCGNSPAYYDDMPILEYTAARRQTNPPYLQILRSSLDSPRLITDMPVNDSILAKIKAVREHNIEDIVAGELVQRYMVTNDVQALFAAITYNPDNYPANLHLGIEYKKVGNYERALHFLVRAITINPNNAQVHNDIGVILAGYRAFDKALYHYSRAIALDSSYALAYNNLGALYAAQEIFDKAIPAFQKAIALKRGYREAQENLDRCLEEQGAIEDDE